MSGWAAAFVTYALTVIIAFFCAGMIFLITVLLDRHSIKNSARPDDRGAPKPSRE